MLLYIYNITMQLLPSNETNRIHITQLDTDPYISIKMLWQSALHSCKHFNMHVHMHAHACSHTDMHYSMVRTHVHVWHFD